MSERTKKLALKSQAQPLLEALELVLDSLGALCNPSELSGWGLTQEQITGIYATIAKAKGIKP